MTAPKVYDPTSPNEKAPALPSAPPFDIGPASIIQPPLSRRGIGPGLVLVLPSPTTIISRKDEDNTKPLDPEPVQKWAEEGFTVAAVTVPSSKTEIEDPEEFDIGGKVVLAAAALKRYDKLDIKDKIGLIIYDEAQVDTLLKSSVSLLASGIAAIVLFSHTKVPSFVAIPVFAHLGSLSDLTESSQNISKSTYPDSEPYFIFPNSSSYDPPSANMAHTRSLSFLRQHIGGPHFDLEAIWEEHTYWEFEKRSVAQTMATMVAEPYVNHVPTMTGGMGREKLTVFYRDHFIFCNPPDTALKPISRTVGPDRIVDEFIFSCTHTSEIPWLLPQVPPTGRLLTIPMIAVVNIRGDRLYHEHIWWDQATVLRQTGILPTHLKAEIAGKEDEIKLPVAGVECARLLVDERDGRSNEMITNKP